jgi:hypothetical protein
MGTKPSLGKASGFHIWLKSGLHERLKSDMAIIMTVSLGLLMTKDSMAVVIEVGSDS